MITCYLKYKIDPYKLTEFENYARLWISLVNELGGSHRGYFLPHEGANDVAIALFDFPSLKAYENYRQASMINDECLRAFKYAEDTRCIVSYERTFMRPVLE